MKRKAYLVLPLLLVAAFSGCDKIKDIAVPAVPLSFEAEVHIVVNEESFKAQMTCEMGEQCTLELTEPENLAGIIVSSDSSGDTLMYDGVEIHSGNKSAAYSVFLEALKEAMKISADKSVCEVLRGQEITEYSAEGKGGAFKLTLDSASGNIISFSVPSVALTANFSNFVKPQEGETYTVMN